MARGRKIVKKNPRCKNSQKKNKTTSQEKDSLNPELQKPTNITNLVTNNTDDICVAPPVNNCVIPTDHYDNSLHVSNMNSNRTHFNNFINNNYDNEEESSGVMHAVDEEFLVTEDQSIDVTVQKEFILIGECNLNGNLNKMVNNNCYNVDEASIGDMYVDQQFLLMEDQSNDLTCQEENFKKFINNSVNDDEASIGDMYVDQQFLLMEDQSNDLTCQEECILNEESILGENFKKFINNSVNDDVASSVMYVDQQFFDMEDQSNDESFNSNNSVNDDEPGTTENQIIISNNITDGQSNNDLSSHSEDSLLEECSGEICPPSKRKKSNNNSSNKTQKKENMKDKHQIMESCNLSCKRKCNEFFDFEERTQINKSFWDLDYFEQKLFVTSHTSSLPSKRSKPGSTRQMLEFKLTKNDKSSIRVCQAFFLTTLGFKKNNNTFIRNAMKTSESDIPSSDKRGKHSNKSKLDESLIRAHIESFGPSISHYRREHAPLRKYLPSDVSITKMHNLFNENYPEAKCSYNFYRTIISNMNISFTKLGHEQCEVCETAHIHQNAEHQKQINDNCEECITFNKHKSSYDTARKHYEADKKNNDANKVVVSTDLQKVIMLPRMEHFKQVVFTKRIVVYNQSFVPVGPKSNNIAMAVVWHQGTAGRKKEDLISTYHIFLKNNRDVENIVIWADNCTSQNKSWALYSFFVYIINSNEIQAQTIQMKYLEKGHTYMSADSFHHQVELSMKNNHANTIYDFNDFKSAVQMANSGRVNVIAPLYSDFAEWPDLVSQYKLNQSKSRPYVSDISCVQFTRGSFDLEYTNNFDDNFIKFSFLSTANIKKKEISPPIFREHPPGVPQETKDDILKKLLNLMPINRRKFWQEL